MMKVNEGRTTSMERLTVFEDGDQFNHDRHEDESLRIGLGHL
jgi:hypothetical protein